MALLDNIGFQDTFAKANDEGLFFDNSSVICPYISSIESNIDKYFIFFKSFNKYFLEKVFNSILF